MFPLGVTQKEYQYLHQNMRLIKMYWNCFHSIKIINKHCLLQFYSTVLTATIYPQFCSWAQQKKWNWGRGGTVIRNHVPPYEETHSWLAFSSQWTCLFISWDCITNRVWYSPYMMFKRRCVFVHFVGSQGGVCYATVRLKYNITCITWPVYFNPAMVESVTSSL